MSSLTCIDRCLCSCRGVISAQLGQPSLLSGATELTSAHVDAALAEGSLGLTANQVPARGPRTSVSLRPTSSSFASSPAGSWLT